MKRYVTKSRAKELWMQAYESAILRNDPTAQGYVDWTTAEYLFSVGKDADEAANRQVAQGRYKRSAL